MTGEGWAGLALGFAGFAITCLSLLVGFVWNAARTATSHDHRIGTLEEKDKRTDGAIDRLTVAVNRLDKHLYAAERLSKSQGQFDNSEAPPRG